MEGSDGGRVYFILYVNGDIVRDSGIFWSQLLKYGIFYCIWLLGGRVNNNNQEQVVKFLGLFLFI